MPSRRSRAGGSTRSRGKRTWSIDRTGGRRCRRAAPNHLADVWIPVGLPGFTGDQKARRQALLDARFGADGWRLAHIVRGRVVSPAEAIVEYEASYRAFLLANRPLVAFLAEQCGNVYDNAVANVLDDDYDQPHTVSNHYQDISVRRVIAELAATRRGRRSPRPSPAKRTCSTSGRAGANGCRAPRACAATGCSRSASRTRPGSCSAPPVVPVHDPALITTIPNRIEWYHLEGCGHLSVEAFWQMSKVVEVRYDRFLASGAHRADPLADS